MATATSAPVSVDPTRGRWLIAGAGVLMQLALGAVYAWSVFSKALQDMDSAFALSKSEAAREAYTTAFTTIAVMAFAAVALPLITRYAASEG